MPLLRLEIVHCENGERFPILKGLKDGMPLFAPTVYSVSMRRSSNLSASTLVSDLRSIMHLYAWAEQQGIDIDRRFEDGEFLNLQGIESVSSAVHQPYRELVTEASHLIVEQQRKLRNNIFQMRRPCSKGPKRVKGTVAGNRLRSIRDYLDWLARQKIGRVAASSEKYLPLETARGEMYQLITARLPAEHDRSSIGQREGLSKTEEARLLEIIDPGSQENPWRSPDVRFRNYLLISILLRLGIRRGEALVIRTTDVNLQKNEVLIRRAPDNPDDPRRYLPNTKTRDRILPLDEELAQLVRDYILKERRKIKAARRHTFLFTSTKGTPLSLAAVSAMFSTLRKRVSGLPANLTPHTLRHTWNDRFSEDMDRNKVREEDEIQQRNYLMGWSETSKTASIYTRRHTRRRAREASLRLQQKWRKPDGK